MLNYWAKNIIYATGDFNARVQKANNREEREHIGKYTFEPETARIEDPSKKLLVAARRKKRKKSVSSKRKKMHYLPNRREKTDKKLKK